MHREPERIPECFRESGFLEVDSDWQAAFCTFAEQIPRGAEIGIVDGLTLISAEHDIRRYRHASRLYISYSAALTFRRSAGEHHAAGRSQVVVRPDGTVVERIDPLLDPKGAFSAYSALPIQEHRADLYLCWAIEAAGTVNRSASQSTAQSSSEQGT
jgi:hypothetical protein